MEENWGRINVIDDKNSTSARFLNLEDLIHRTGIGAEQVNTLIRVGALRVTGKNKKELLWEANFLHKRVHKGTTVSAALFKERSVNFKLPKLHHTTFEDAMGEIGILGFPYVTYLHWLMLMFQIS